MHVVITGAAGFLGRRLADRLLSRGRLDDQSGVERTIDRLTLIDVVSGTAIEDARVRQLTGDVADRDLLRAAIDRDTAAVFHLAAVVSGMAEADFDLGMRVNLDATRHLLDVCRERGQRPRVVFTSSVAVFGGPLPATVLDTTAVTPQSSYGTQKAAGELLVCDYSRKGFIDGRVLRLPTISVRPGRPNAAMSSFASGIIREPLNGQVAVCPVEPAARLWLLSPARAIDCLIAGQQISSDALGASRMVNLPGVSVTVGEMVAALERTGGAAAVGRIHWQIDPLISQVVAGWPGAFDTSRARALGFPGDPDFDAIIRGYVEHELGRRLG